MKNGKKVDAGAIAKALKDSLMEIAKTAVSAIESKENPPAPVTEPKPGEQQTAPVQKNLEIKIDETVLAGAIAKALKAAGVDGEDEADGEGVAPTEEQVNSAVAEVAKKLNLKPSDIQITAKGIKKGKLNADAEDGDGDEDEEFVKKLVGSNSDFESDEYAKKFSKMSQDEKDAELDNYFGNILNKK